jgi:hypothetical protein
MNKGYIEWGFDNLDVRKMGRSDLAVYMVWFVMEPYLSSGRFRGEIGFFSLKQEILVETYIYKTYSTNNSDGGMPVSMHVIPYATQPSISSRRRSRHEDVLQPG